MKILLIYPDVDSMSIVPNGLINIEPLGLEYLAGELYDHDVTILDMKIEKSWKRVIENIDPDVVGITGTITHLTRMIEILDYVKKVNPATVTVVGGTHATLVPNDFLMPQVDVLIKGHQTAPFRQIVESLEKEQSYENINGIMIQSGNSWRSNGHGVLHKNLDHLPMPRRELTQQYRSKYCHLFWKPIALMLTSVGCPHNCGFCPCPELTGRKVLRRSPSLVVEELMTIEEEYIYICDDNLFFDYKHALEIARLIKESGIKKQFYALVRSDNVVKHPKLVEKWAEVGMKKLFLGLESPNDDEIKALNKKGTVSENNKAIEILHENRIDTLGAFIVNPNYTRSDFDRILEYMDRMKIFYFEFTILTPLPGTRFHTESTAKINSGDTRLYDLAHSVLPTQLPIRKFYKEFNRLNRKAASPFRALRTKPFVSPFKNMGYIKQAPQIFDLFVSAWKSYRKF